MKNKKMIFILSLIILVILSIVLFTSYGFINTKIGGNETSKKAVFNSQILKVEYSDGTETLTSGDNGYFKPGSTLTKTFTITNTGNVPVKYSINLTEIENNFERFEDLTYEIKRGEDVLNSGVFPQSDTYIVSKDTLELNESKTYTLIINYLNSEENQIVDTGRVLKSKITIDDTIKTISSLLVYGNSVQNGTPSPEAPVEIESLGEKVDNLFTKDNITPQEDNYGTLKYKWEEDGSIWVYNTSVVMKTATFDITLPAGKYTVSNADYEIHLYKNGTNVDYSNSRIKTVSSTEKFDLRITIFFSPGTYNVKMLLLNGIYTKETVPEFENNSKYRIPVNISSKNLFDFNKDLEYRIVGSTKENISNGVKLTSTINTSNRYSSYFSYTLNKDNILGKTITLSADFKLSEGNVAMFRFGYWNNTSYSFISPDNTYISIKKNGRYKITVNVPKEMPETAEKYAIFFNTSTLEYSNGHTLEVKNIQVEIGDEATSYEIYQEPKITYIYLNEPLRKVGYCDICSDYIDFKNGRLSKNTKYYESIYDALYNKNSASRWGWGNNGGNASYKRTWGYGTLVASYNSAPMCNTFLGSYGGVSYARKEHFQTSSDNGYLYIALPYPIFEEFAGLEANTFLTLDVSEQSSIIDEYMITNKVDYLIALRAPILEDIELPKIEALQRVTNNISICSENGVCASKIEVEYDD